MTTNQPTLVTGTGIAVALAVAIALAFLFFGPSLFAPFDMRAAPAAEAVPPGPEGATMNTTNDTDTLMVKDTLVGTGTEAVAGKQVTVNYEGRLENGQVFDSSASHGQPFTFALGTGQVIAGWEQGIAGMKVGGKRTLTIPPELGYGAQAVGPIPANSTLIFDVELVEVR